jgi:hypothetical protein
MRNLKFAIEHGETTVFAESSTDQAEAITVLSDSDFVALSPALVDSPEPNEALKEGFRWYRQLTA